MMRPSRPILVMLLVLSAPGSARAQTTWHVDDDCTPPGTGTGIDPFCTIQMGVDAASDGHTVLVRAGIYVGAGNRDVSLYGKAILLKSKRGPAQTILDIQGGPTAIQRGFFLVHGESNETVIEGFTITNGYLIGDTGGSGAAGGGGGAGIYIRESSPTIRNCIVRSNFSATLGVAFLVDGRGGGVYIDGNSQAVIEKCAIVENTCEKRGGGMYVGYAASEVVIRNCLVANNVGGGGGGIYNALSSTVLANSTIAFNISGGGGGITSSNSDILITNCIVWGNQAPAGPQMIATCPSLPTIEYSDFDCGSAGIGGSCSSEVIWGLGNVDAEPLFLDSEGSDFRLLSSSPCIDAGNNQAVPPGVVTDLDGHARFHDDPTTPDTGNPGPPGLGITDMGAYEFGGQDCNGNGVRDREDIENGTSDDCNDNNIPDECEHDCNTNGQADLCDIADGTSDDCDLDSNPDECQIDCNANGQPDNCDIADGSSDDCNLDGIPDDCAPYPPIAVQPQDQQVQPGELAMFGVTVVGLLPDYQWRKDGVDLQDDDRIIGSQLALLFILDVIPEDAGEYDCVISDIITGCENTSDAATLTVLTDCPADFDGSGAVGPFDLAILLGNWGPNPNHPADLDGDGTIAPPDLAILLGHWGPCQ